MVEHTTRFIMANTQENMDLLNSLSTDWFVGEENYKEIEIEFFDEHECARVRDLMKVMSSQFQAR